MYLLKHISSILWKQRDRETHLRHAIWAPQRGQPLVLRLQGGPFLLHHLLDDDGGPGPAVLLSLSHLTVSLQQPGAAVFQSVHAALLNYTTNTEKNTGLKSTKAVIPPASRHANVSQLTNEVDSLSSPCGTFLSMVEWFLCKVTGVCVRRPSVLPLANKS